MSEFNAWLDYFYPGTEVLKNKYDLRSYANLRILEYAASAARADELNLHKDLINKTFDLPHLQSIHRYLFQDVYEWAGQLRTVDISKGYSNFAGIDGQIYQYMNDAKQIIDSTDWRSLSHDAFAEKISAVFANVNQAHPFRDGNGRSTRLFLHDLATKSNFELDFEQVTAQEWNQNSSYTSPDIGGYKVYPEFIVDTFKKIAQPRSSSNI